MDLLLASYDSSESDELADVVPEKLTSLGNGLTGVQDVAHYQMDCKSQDVEMVSVAQVGQNGASVHGFTCNGQSDKENCAVEKDKKILVSDHTKIGFQPPTNRPKRKKLTKAEKRLLYPPPRTIVNRESLHKMNYLYAAAHQAPTPAIASHIMRSSYLLKEKSVVRFTPDVNRTACKRCKGLLVPGATSRVRIKCNEHGRYRVVTCMQCGFYVRFGLNECKLKIESCPILVDGKEGMKEAL